MNCILYVNKTDCQWRMTPKDFPPYNTVFYYFTKWKREVVLENVMDALREKLHVLLGRDESPSIGIIDSRSIKTSQHVDKGRGLDRNKKIKGRKCLVVVDTLGLPIAVSVQGANIHNSKGADLVLSRLTHKFPRLRKILADGGYRGDGVEGEGAQDPNPKLPT